MAPAEGAEWAGFSLAGWLPALPAASCPPSGAARALASVGAGTGDLGFPGAWAGVGLGVGTGAPRGAQGCRSVEPGTRQTDLSCMGPASGIVKPTAGGMGAARMGVSVAGHAKCHFACERM